MNSTTLPSMSSSRFSCSSTTSGGAVVVVVVGEVVVDVGEVVVVVDKVEDADVVEEKLEKSVSVRQKQVKEGEISLGGKKFRYYTLEDIKSQKKQQEQKEEEGEREE